MCTTEVNLPDYKITELGYYLKPVFDVKINYRCCCITEPVILSHCAHLKLWHRFHALLKVCSDCDDIVPLTEQSPEKPKCSHSGENTTNFLFANGDILLWSVFCKTYLKTK